MKRQTIIGKIRNRMLTVLKHRLFEKLSFIFVVTLMLVCPTFASEYSADSQIAHVCVAIFIPCIIEISDRVCFIILKYY